MPDVGRRMPDGWRMPGGDPVDAGCRRDAGWVPGGRRMDLSIKANALAAIFNTIRTFRLALARGLRLFTLDSLREPEGRVIP